MTISFVEINFYTFYVVSSYIFYMNKTYKKYSFYFNVSFIFQKIIVIIVLM